MVKEVDCRGLACPQPVIDTKNALEEMEKGQIITIVDNEVAKENVRKLAQKMNVTADVKEEDEVYYITMKKGDNSIPKEVKNLTPEKSTMPSNEELVILISNDKLGQGSDELGESLMKSYLYTLTEVDPKPNKLIFLNNGVTLNCTASSSIENIKKLEEIGVEVLSCGACLDYYGLKEDVQVGTISNMYSIVEALNEASKTIIL